MVRDGAVTVLFKGGRLASWHRLSPARRQAYEQEHVDLMLAIAKKHGMRRMEGFRLMAPPYGQYGYYEYYLARGGLPEYCADWAKGVLPATPLPGGAHQVPRLDVDRGSVVAVLFERVDFECDDATIGAMNFLCLKINTQRGVGTAFRIIHQIRQIFKAA